MLIDMACLQNETFYLVGNLGCVENENVKVIPAGLDPSASPIPATRSPNHTNMNTNTSFRARKEIHR